MEMLPWVYTAIASFVLYAFAYRWVLNRNFNGPKLWPVVGCVFEVAVNRHRMHDWVTDYCKLYYPTWRMPVANVKFVVSVDPANVEYVLKTNFNNYVKGQLQYDQLFDLVGNGIFSSDGDLWRRHRKVASYEFASKVLRDFSSETFKRHALSLCRILLDASKDNRPVDVMNLGARISFESICKVGFGVDMGILDPSLPESSLDKSFDAVTKRCSDRYVDPFWKLKKLFGVGTEAAMKKDVDHINSFTENFVMTRKAELESSKQTKPDLLSRFVEAIKTEPFTSNPLKDLQDVVTNFVLAGRDTTAAALAWTLYALSLNPRVEEKILEELLEIERAKQTMKCDRSEGGETPDTFPDHETRAFADFVGLLNYDTVNNRMQYLQAVISESMRLYPPVPSNARMALKDDILPCGTEIRAGDFFMYSPYSQGRMEQVWGEDCLEFKPERWLRDGVYRAESPFKFPNFHAGPRICLGKDSALHQLKVTLATLLRFFSLKMVPGQKVTYKVSITLQMPDDGCKMIPQKRQASPHSLSCDGNLPKQCRRLYKQVLW